MPSRERTPAPKRPAPKRPAPKRPAPKRPAPKRPAPKRPAPKRPAPKRPAPKRPAPKRPAPKRPAPKRPAPKRPPRGASRRPPILEPPGPERGLIDATTLFRRRPRIPGRVLLCFFLDLLRSEERAGRLAPRTHLTGEGDPVPVYTTGRDRHQVAVAWAGLTAPFSAAVLEELIGLGGKTFVCCGGAGVLDGDLPVGTPIVVTRALRDEGTSYHYQRAARWVRPDPAVTASLRAACQSSGVAFRTGATWTTDGLYRETPRQIRRRRAEGCLTVEMEAAALFAVARHRGVALGQLLYAGDDVSGDRWNHRNWNAQQEARARAYHIALHALRTRSV